MKFILNSILALSLALASAFAISSLENNIEAEAADANDAVLVIRFNKPTVTYQDQLFYVVREAVKIKPTVIFDVVAVTPNGAVKYGQRVASDIARIGVSPAQINYHAETGGVSDEEVRIFVR